ncbi:MAG: hypothetical protein LBE92_20120 [Chryseobacterium sp.]|jgi:hypothetical protein|uniref:hypothetical protein n=1 Tax=Chryseobacterium sp. TaxID=1871047 RepID=UPI0028385B22|nr:hypothetical protein [Chryseobacterium sp.]MDR2238440.1 hypothetical protein [Chryseobacterium sp.]
MGKITIIIALFMMISCDKNSDFMRNNKETGKFVKKNTFIDSPGIYYFRDINIIVKEFKDDTIVYGISDYYNNLLYQRNINNSISNHMKWTIYIDNQSQIWFYNTDYQEINVFITEGKKYIFIKDKNKLPPLPTELSKFIKE